ncbi:MAG: DivIVA domain-containing protein [Actinomycetota bacterium]|nr:DivIVA domain-containing protein [Actinomycetota bacterium]
MPLSPNDIEGRHFLPALRGYDREQVDAFLTEIAEDYRTLLRKFQVLTEQNRDASEANDQLFGLGERVERVLRTAVQSAEEIRAAGEEEVARLRDEARRALQAGQQALAKAAHQSDMVAADAADVRKRRDEAQRMLDQAEQVRAAVDREAAEMRATAQLEAAGLREAAEREAATMRATAGRDAADLREAAERDSADLREAAERDAADLREAAERDAADLRVAD